MSKTTLKRAEIGERTEIALKFAPATQAELKAIGDEIPDGYVAGWASTPDLDSYHHVVVAGAFDAAISKRGLTGPKGIKLLIGHDWDKPAGVIKVLETRGGRLWIEAQLGLNISYARDAYEASKIAGGLNFSVGFMLQDYEFKEDGDGDEYLVINRGDLFEVSIVPFPANEEATMEFVKAADPGPINTIAEFERALVALGFAKGRNEAHRFALAAKSPLFREHAHLFLASPSGEVKPEPVSAAETITKLSGLLADLTSTLAPEA